MSRRRIRGVIFVLIGVIAVLGSGYVIVLFANRPEPAPPTAYETFASYDYSRPAFSPDGRWFARCERAPRIHDLSQPLDAGEWIGKTFGDGLPMAFSRDSKILFVAGGDTGSIGPGRDGERIRAYLTDSLQKIRTIETPELKAESLAVCPKTGRLVMVLDPWTSAGSTNKPLKKTVVAVDLMDWSIHTLIEDASNVFREPILVPQGCLVAFLDGKRFRIDCISVSDGRVLYSKELPEDGPFAIATSPDGKTLVAGGSDRTCTVWSLPKFEQLLKFRAPAVTEQIAVHPNTGWIVAGCVHPRSLPIKQFDVHTTLCVWDSRGTEIGSFRAHHGGLEALGISPDGRFVVTNGRDSQMRVWDWERVVAAVQK